MFKSAFGAVASVRRDRRSFVIRWLIFATFVCGYTTSFASDSGHGAELAFPPDLDSYGDAGRPMLERLGQRITSNPFNLVGTLIFFPYLSLR